MKYAIALLTLFLCACGTKVTMYHTAPPRNGAPVVHRVTVMPFEGDRGGYVTSSLATMLPQLKYEDAQAYQVLDRENIKDIIAEQEFQMTIADPDTMMEFGMLAGIEGGFTGDIFYDNRVSYRQEERSERVDNRTRRYFVTCTDKEYSLRLGIKLTDYRTSSVIYSRSFAEAVTERSCPDQGYYNSYRDYYVEMANSVLQEIKQDLGEYQVQTAANLASKDELIEDKADKKSFEAAVEFMESGDANRACEAWGALEMKYNYAPYVAYNLGVCSEMSGDFDGALKRYNKAANLLEKPDKMVNEAISRVNRKIEQGIR
jgi:tetratricopeptide (TPR) repeat protein